MRLATHQPSLFPWAGFWHKFASVDVMGVLVDVQFDASSNQNRCMLQGDWLTVPVAKEDRHKLIKDVRFADGFKPVQLMHRIRGRMPRKQFPWLEERCHGMFIRLESDPTLCLSRRWFVLAELMMGDVMAILGLTGRAYVTIPPAPYVGETKNDRLWEHVARIQEYPGTYVCGPGTASYINPTDTHGWTVDIQEEVDETLPDRFQSVLYFIGKYEDPLGEMLKRFRLKPLLGGGDGAVCETGHSSGRPEGGQ